MSKFVIGNQLFVAGEDIEAIENYTRSLAYANSNELMAYAHANRSAALYRKQMYKECLLDVEAALELDYPLDKRQKLKERGIKAMEKLGESMNIKSNEQKLNTCPFDDVESTLKKFPLISPIETEITEKKNVIKNIIDDDNDKPIKPRYLQNPETMSQPYGPSDESPAHSKGIDIIFSKEYGRHLVASKEFKPGEILTIEKPYFWVLYRDKFYTHCHYCLERSYCLIPCPDCPIAQYCSDKCRKLGWNMFHRTECPVLSVLVNLFNIIDDKVKMDMVIKIIRLLVVATSNGKKFDELQKDLETAETNPDNRTAGFTDSGILDSSSGRSAMSLATNMITRPLIGISAFACVSALAAMLLATQTKLFGRKYQLPELQDIDAHPNIKFSGSLMLRACVITASNCFSIQPEPGIKSGSGLYVAHSLYNHSCAPNTFRHFEGIKMITRAMEPIYPGDQIFTGYGADYSYMSREKRKEKLSEEYFFDCQCSACIDDWPTYAYILEHHVGSISKNKQLVAMLKPYKQRLLTNKYDIDAVKEVMIILHKEVKKPCEEILHAVQYLRSFYLVHPFVAVLFATASALNNQFAIWIYRYIENKH
ncbi:hypothetical protein PV327_001930 [Microctonus hyperodae]|uniref:SET and MYND domain-containing protein 4 n=1 Tax=Microctonus hyperodae TaxID=165561 RepID=A0AA39FEL4_MICHY|nr:hypothetical protein PV327_001930 [Microctonus hyperodae]